MKPLLQRLALLLIKKIAQLAFPGLTVRIEIAARPETPAKPKS